MRLDPFYPVMPNADWVETVVTRGAKLVQLRAKNMDDVTLPAEAVRAKGVCERAGATLVLNDYWQLAIDLGIDFVHLGQEDLDGADVDALKRRGIRLGVSTHDHAELDRALQVGPDYIALGPVYPTALKAMPWAAQGLERVREWNRLINPVPLVAIGGLTIPRAHGVMEAGAASLAVVTDLVMAADPDRRAAEWVQATRIFAASS